MYYESDIIASQAAINNSYIIKANSQCWPKKNFVLVFKPLNNICVCNHIGTRRIEGLLFKI